MDIVFKCIKCNEVDIDLSNDINKIINRSKEVELVYRDRFVYNSNFNESTTKHWMSEYNKLSTRHTKTMETKAKHLNKMKQSCYDKLAAQNEYIHDLEQAVLMYRKLQKEQYNIRRIK